MPAETPEEPEVDGESGSVRRRTLWFTRKGHDAECGGGYKAELGRVRLAEGEGKTRDTSFSPNGSARSRRHPLQFTCF